MPDYVIRPVGRVESPQTDRSAAPRQGDEGAPDCVIVVVDPYAVAVQDVGPGAELLVLTLAGPGRAGRAGGPAARGRRPAADRGR